MATQNLPFLTDRFTNNLIQFIDQQLAAQPAMKLSGCAFESPESCSGACDGGSPCQSSGTIFDLATDQPFCAKHFGRN